MNLSAFSYAVMYDLHDLWLTQVIHDVIDDDLEVRGHIFLFHSTVLTNTVILVYYLSQSVQKNNKVVALIVGWVSVWRQNS